MSYSKFTAKELKQQFGIEQVFKENLFSQTKPRAVNDWLKAYLHETIEFALAQNTEKARSEFIIAPVFLELRRQAKEKISIFSGIEFNVDKKLKLTGACDFLVSRSSYQAVLEAPIVIAVEAKRQDFEKGYVQCIAEMYAAGIFNERENNPARTICGTVTTGDVWRFLMLEGNKALIETVSFDIREDLERILGILWAMTFDEIKRS
jgi:hypothetical protein